jgi:microcystin-dependent protein
MSAPTVSYNVSPNPDNVSMFLPGMLMMWGGATAPSTWLLCDGSLVSRTVYSNLFTAIGTAFGVGDGTTTFALPSTGGRTVRGVGSAVGTTGTTSVALGDKAGDDGTIMTYDMIAQHSHQQLAGSGVTVLNGGGTSPCQGLTDNVGSVQTSAAVRNAANTATAPTTPNKVPTLNQYVGVNYIIKY